MAVLEIQKPAETIEHSQTAIEPFLFIVEQPTAEARVTGDYRVSQDALVASFTENHTAAIEALKLWENIEKKRDKLGSIGCNALFNETDIDEIKSDFMDKQGLWRRSTSSIASSIAAKFPNRDFTGTTWDTRVALYISYENRLYRANSNGRVTVFSDFMNQKEFNLDADIAKDEDWVSLLSDVVFRGKSDLSGPKQLSFELAKTTD